MHKKIEDITPKNKFFSPRRRARSFAMQAVYQWKLNPTSAQELIDTFLQQYNFNKCDIDYFKFLVINIIQKLPEIDASMQPFLDRAQNELTLVELAVLRMAVYELIFCKDIPFKVVINEALEIAKRYGSEEGFRYINGILDKMRHTIRPGEDNLT